jgi:hypothetical protein
MSVVSDLKLTRSGYDLAASWSSTYAAGTVYQLYLGRVLSWWGTTLTARLPYPPSGSSVAVDVLALLSGDNPGTDYSSSLPTAPATDRVNLSWLGGTFLGLDIDHYNIYGPASTSGGISTTTPLATVPAYAGVITDGWGCGGWNEGGWDQANCLYSWTSSSLGPGTWYFSIAAADVAGNIGTPLVTSATTVGPPNAPAPFSDTTRLHYAYNAGTHVATLSWNASP